jgi:hypothetical protein
MEIIRLLLLQQESEQEMAELKQFDEKIVVHNLALMLDAGLIVGEMICDETGTPVAGAIIRLTWAGHDFLDSTRDPKIWTLANEKVLKPGMSWTFSLLVEFLKAEARRHLDTAFGFPPQA